MTVPEQIGPYEVVRPIAQGGMAEVFEVRDPRTRERLALKLLVELKTSVKRFNREFEAMTRLNHPCIVRVFRYGFHGRNPWLTMELLDGTPLQHRMKAVGAPGEPRRTAEGVRVGQNLASALSYLHDRGLIHRDLKSANVVILPDGRVKLIDFGTAHLVDPLERITREGDFIGTFTYAAPEQIVGGRVDARSDLYALGVLLYRLVTGRRPFRSDDPKLVAQMHLTDPPRPLRDYVPDLPPQLEKLILELMAKEPGQRPQTAGEVARRLDQLLGVLGDASPPGSLAVVDRAVGRDPLVRQLWHSLGTGDGPRAVVLHGSDEAERLRLLGRITDEAAGRGFRPVRPARVDPWPDTARALAGVLAGSTDPKRAERQVLLSQPGLVPAGSLADVCDAALPTVLAHQIDGAEPLLLVLDEPAELPPDVRALWLRLLREASRKQVGICAVLTAPEPTSSLRALERAGVPTEASALLPLDAREVGSAAGVLLHRRPPPPDVARRLHVLTGGWPTRLDALMRQLVAERVLTARDDDPNRVAWHAPALEAALDEHTTMDPAAFALPAAWRRVLEARAVLGTDGTRERLQRLLDVDPGALRVLLAQLVDAGLVVWVGTPGREVRPTDPLQARGLLAAIHPARRALLLSRAAALIQDEAPSRETVRILLAVGRADEALRHATAHAEALVQAGRPREALDVLALVRGDADHPGLPRDARAALQLVLGRATLACDPMDPAGAKALSLAEALADDRSRIAAIRLASAALYDAIGHPSGCRRALEAAWADAEAAATLQAPAVAPPALSVAAAVRLADHLAWSGDLDGAMTWLKAAHTVPGRSEALGAESAVHRARLRMTTGDLDAAEDGLRAAVGKAEAAGHAAAAWLATAALGHVLRRQARYSEALASVEEALDVARDAGQPVAWLELLLSAAELELDLGRLGRAQELIDEALSAAQRGEGLALRLRARALHGRVQLASGLVGLSVRTLADAVQGAEAAGLTRVAARAGGALGLAQWRMGDREAANQRFRASLIALRDLGDLLGLADVCVSRARAIQGAEEADRSFKLVAALVGHPSQRALAVERHLAALRHARLTGDEAAAEAALALAQPLLNRIAAGLGPIEAAAMRVHPWTREVLRSLGEGAA